jgi:hypothetical protein
MSIVYRIVPDRNLLLVEGHGVLSYTDLIEFRTNLAHDPQLQEGLRELADFRSVKKFELDVEGFHEFLNVERSYAKLFQNFRIAIVTNSDLHFGFAQMYKGEIGDKLTNVQVFRDMEKAKDWLFDDVEEADTQIP